MDECAVPRRKAYILTSEEETPRNRFSIPLLKSIGFDVVVFPYIKHDDPIISNKTSMMKIYEMIVNSGETYSYVFEDDINVMESITLSDILKYEAISPRLFFLGCCIPEYQTPSNYKKREEKLDERDVIVLSGAVRGIHALGLSKDVAQELLNYAKKSEQRHMDMILEEFTLINPANVYRYDLESSMDGHRGMFFQDRTQFCSTLIQNY